MILRFCFQLHQDGIKAHLGMAFQKDSQLVECFNHHLHRMIQNGAMSHIKGRARSNNRKFKRIDDAVMLSYKNVIFPSLVLLTGIALSISQLAMEKVWARIAWDPQSQATSLEGRNNGKLLPTSKNIPVIHVESAAQVSRCCHRHVALN